MRAVAVTPAAKELGIVDHPEPALQGPTDVAVRVLEVGICGTDREIAAFQYGFPPPGQRSLVIGHECLAEVIEVGREVDRVAVGDRVVPMVRRPCRRADCLACPRGRQDFCYTGEFTERGIQGAHGFMTERVVDDQRFMHRVPRELRDVGVLVEPLTIAEKALIQVRDVQERLPWECRQARESGQAPPLRALVLGAGPVGLLGAMALRNAGFETTVYSREPRGSAKARLVEQFGGRYVSAGDHDAGALQRTLGRVDLVYEAVGASRLAFEVLEVLGSNAVFVFTGVPGRKAPVEVDTASVMRNMVLDNQVLLGTVNAGPDAFEAAVGDLAAFRRRWPEALGSLITGRYPLDKHAELLQGERTGIKNVLQVGGG